MEQKKVVISSLALMLEILEKTIAKNHAEELDYKAYCTRSDLYDLLKTDNSNYYECNFVDGKKLRFQGLKSDFNNTSIFPQFNEVSSQLKEASEQTVEYINLDALDSLKYKLKEKYDVLFNKFEVTEFERGELDAFTQTLYMIDDIMEKQATSDKTSDTQKDNVNHQTYYNVHKHECIDEMIALFGVDETMAFCKLNAWKYRYRAGAKDGESKEKDLKKADEYLDMLIDLNKEKQDD